MGSWVRCGLAAVMLALGAGWAADARATLVRGFSLPGLVAEAHSVLRGEVAWQEVVYDARWGRVYTHSFLVVDEVLAGREAVGDVVVVRQLGGELDGVLSQVPGTARLEVGAEVVVFARTDGAFHYLVGMAQGAFEVRREAPGRVTLRRSTAGLTVPPVAGPTRPLAPDALTLDALRAQVRDQGRAGGRQ